MASADGSSFNVDRRYLYHYIFYFTAVMVNMITIIVASLMQLNSTPAKRIHNRMISSDSFPQRVRIVMVLIASQFTFLLLAQFQLSPPS